MTFGEQNSLPQSFQLLDKAFDSGINFFDSAEMYPVPQRAETQGRSEEYLGRWIRCRNIPRDRVVLATKLYFSIAKRYGVHPVSLAIETWRDT
ncbi:UNVERIFIED_CONTAM: hypothetical protein Sradi_0463400 [Sesamum radiatum]|uniref:NADP-dependent oxidoreductase domain-containing protein n=1 Tax=Sesamum radiatum TaxID=300843 RepID=A0AAW2W8H2_SESRA